MVNNVSSYRYYQAKRAAGQPSVRKADQSSSIPVFLLSPFYLQTKTLTPDKRMVFQPTLRLIVLRLENQNEENQSERNRAAVEAVRFLWHQWQVFRNRWKIPGSREKLEYTWYLAIFGIHWNLEPYSSQKAKADEPSWAMQACHTGSFQQPKPMVFLEETPTRSCSALGREPAIFLHDPRLHGLCCSSVTPQCTARRCIAGSFSNCRNPERPRKVPPDSPPEFWPAHCESC